MVWYNFELIITWPPEFLVVDPALIVFPVLMLQCAAVKIVHSSKIVPPQNWKLPDSIATCQGIIEGATSPPTILSAFCINVGISAVIFINIYKRHKSHGTNIDQIQMTVSKILLLNHYKNSNSICNYQPYLSNLYLW